MTKTNKLKKKINKKLKSAQFRLINEKLYKSTSKEAKEFFSNQNESFSIYHEGFENQLKKWPNKPLDIIFDWICSKHSSLKIGDFGCGKAELYQKYKKYKNGKKSIGYKVPKHKFKNFDLVSSNKHVTVCDISKVPLKSDYLDVAIYCLSLMGKNFPDFLLEANRVLKKDGILKIAEVRSRMSDIRKFVKLCQNLGFDFVRKDGKNCYFVIFEFIKNKNVSSLPKIEDPFDILKPCLYKNR